MRFLIAVALGAPAAWSTKVTELAGLLRAASHPCELDLAWAGRSPQEQAARLVRSATDREIVILVVGPLANDRVVSPLPASGVPAVQVSFGADPSLPDDIIDLDRTDGLDRLMAASRQLSGHRSHPVGDSGETGQLEREARNSTPDVTSAPKSRFTDVRFLNPSGIPRSNDQPLRSGGRYILEVAVRAHPIGIGAAEQRAPLALPPAPTERNELALLVDVASDDFDVTPLAETILLPAGGGDSLSSAQFRVGARRHGDAMATLEVRIYYQFNLIEIARVLVDVVAPTAPPAVPARPASLEQTLRVRSYAELDQLQPRAMNVLVERPTGGEFHLSFTVTGGDARQQVLRATCHLTAGDIEDQLVTLREVLHQQAARGKFDEQGGSSDAMADATLFRLAELGSGLWSSLFARTRGGAAFALGRWLEERSLPAGSLIQVTLDPKAREFVFPWSLLYDRRREKGAAPDPEGFWGCRYQIEQQIAGGPVISDEPLQSATINMAFMLWRSFRNASAQEALVAGFGNASAGKLEVAGPITAAAGWWELLRAKDTVCDLLYFYSHGYTRSRKADVAGTDGLDRFVALYREMEEGSAARQALDRAYEEVLEGKLANQDSYIELSTGKLYLRELYDGVAALPGRPLVFLNMCESAQVTPSLTDSFVHFFLDRGASSVVGTECPMTIEFAHPFAALFLDRILRGRSVGAALLEARQHFLRRGSALGLAYTLFGSATTRYQTPCLDGSTLTTGSPPQ